MNRATGWSRPCAGVALLLLPLGLAAGPRAAAAARAPFDSADLRVQIGGYWTLRLAAQDGAWDPAVRSKPSFKFVDCGYVTASEGTPERFRVSVRLQLDGGSRSPGHVFYDMEFLRQADGVYTGAFTEVSGLSRATGSLTACLEPRQPAAAERRACVRRDEFPRLLLRQSDVPALRAKFATPLGQAFLARAGGMNDPVVLGVLYQATGNARHAGEAMKIVGGMGDIDANGRLSGEFGHTIVRVALTLDLCYDAWPEDFRAGLLRQIKARLPKRQYVLLGEAPNYNQVSNYYGPSLGSAAIASILLYGARGAEPSAPVKPLCVLYGDGRVPPLADYQPPQGVPVVPLEDDVLPRDWIYAGGFTPADGADLLAPLGGPAKARPTLDDAITDGRTVRQFKPVSHETDQGYYVWHDRTVLDVTSAIGRLYHTESYFYTAIRNDQPGWYEFFIGSDHQESFVYLNGVPIEEGHVVHLERGLYTLLVKVRIGQTEPWGREMLAARFARLKHGKKNNVTVDDINAAIRARYDQALTFHETEMAEWKARNEEDLECLRIFHKGREQMYWHYRTGIGDGGFQAEVSHYGNIAARYPLLYAACFRTAFGRDVSPHPDATHVLPRQMMQACFQGDLPTMMDMNVHAQFGAGWCADYFPIVPEAWKPSVLWGWNRLAGVRTASARDLDRNAADRIAGAVNGTSLATTFVNYPVDLDPVHPDQGMPRTWAADTLGFYVFRSGWQGGDDFIAQVFLKSIPIHAWSHPNAGAFRLWGLGHPWTSAPIDRSGYRPEESVVLLPDDVNNEGACARLTHRQAGPDGSGSLAFDMNDVYLTARESARKKLSEDEKTIRDVAGFLQEHKTGEDDFGITDAVKEMPMTQSVLDYYREKDRDAIRRTIPRLYNGYGRRLAGVDRASAVTGSRAAAFDFSGASGAPCLMALVDSIRGGKAKQWLWHLPAGGDYRVRVDGRAITVAYPDATLKATLVSPADAKLAFMEDRKMSFIYRGGSAKGQLITRSYNFFAAETKAKDADFFVVLTVQRGAAPEVGIAGDGLAAVVTVGGQTVTCREGRIVLGGSP